mgnify:CR=1 FL=1
MMAGTTVECELAMAFTEYIPNMALASVADECMQEIGAPDWTDEDYRLAREFLNTYNEQTKTMIRKEIIDKYGRTDLRKFWKILSTVRFIPLIRQKLSWKPVPPMWETWVCRTDPEHQCGDLLYWKCGSYMADDGSVMQPDCP